MKKTYLSMFYAKKTRINSRKIVIEALIEILLKLSTAKYWSESHWDSGSRTLLQLSTDQYKSCVDSTIERSARL